MEQQTQLPMTNYGFRRWDQKHMDKLKDVLSMQGPKRWRAAANLALYLNPRNPMDPSMNLRKEDAIIRLEVKKLQQSLRESDNEMGVSNPGKRAQSDGGRRYAMRMPALMLQFIELIDPTLHSGTPEERRESLRLLMKTFPEYRVLTKI